MSTASFQQIVHRYELKYIIPKDLIEPISNFASVYCHLDTYSEDSDDKFYTINNLYLDSPTFKFLKDRMEEVNGRFNMRVRTYGNKPALPYFMEIKQKIGNILKKTRAMVYLDDWPFALTQLNHVFKNYGNEQNRINIEEFIGRAIAHQVEPKVFTRYERMAFVSDVDTYGRLTIDKNLQYREAHNYDFNSFDTLINCDCDRISLNNNEVLLELKCYTNAVPMWMIDLIKTFNLRQTAFSKYLVGMRDVFNSVKLINNL